MTDRYIAARAELMKEISFPDPASLLAHALLETVNWNAPSDRSHLLQTELPRFMARVHLNLSDTYEAVQRTYGTFRAHELRRQIDYTTEQVAALLTDDNDRPTVVDGFVLGLTNAVDAVFATEIAVVSSIG